VSLTADAPGVAADGEARAGAVFAALGDGTRRQLWRTVVDEGPITATALARALPITRQAVAKHLRVLDDAGLVRADRVGRELRYSAPPGSLRAVSEWIDAADAAWAERLSRLKARAEAGA
jgi:DNA-binding transcriptional ArsR family regulator